MLIDAVQDHRTSAQQTSYLPTVQDQPHPCRKGRRRPRPVPGRRLDPAFDLTLLQPHGRHPKKDGSVRITINYKKLNAISSLGQLPIPRVDEVVDSFGKGRIFSLFDLVSSFHQITIDKDTIPLTAFCTQDRLFEWLVMPQGSSAAPGWFVKIINEVITGWQRVAAYLDDIIVFDPDPTDYVANIRALFGRLRKHHLKRSPSKAKIVATTADFLGHTISAGGYSPNSDKVAALTKLSMPTDKKQV